jgi:hypothetical protein
MNTPGLQSYRAKDGELQESAYRPYSQFERHRFPT